MNLETLNDAMYYGWTCGENKLRPIINQTIQRMRARQKRSVNEGDIIHCANCQKPMRAGDGLTAHWRKIPATVCPECFDRLWIKGRKYTGRDA